MNLQKNISLKKFSTFHIGGLADFFIEICTKADLIEALNFAEEKNLPTLMLGGGSNIIFSDDGFKGLVLQFRNNAIEQIENKNFRIESGTKIMEIFSATKKKNRDFSVFSTIPGTLGGAIAGNAGLPDGEIGDHIHTVEMYDRKAKKFSTYLKKKFNFTYRHTNFHNKEFSDRYVIWSAEIFLDERESKKISERAKFFLQTRKEKQPWGKTGGSFFANPKEGAAGKFLDQIGMKNFSLPNSDAFFSEKHANFMMNRGSATQQKIIELAQYAQKKVAEKFSVPLRNEVKLLDEVGNVIIL